MRQKRCLRLGGNLELDGVKDLDALIQKLTDDGYGGR